ncbi:unnamed protein product [Owenia fusiformis]|uniref:Metalloendopeptidase n=1 Tax=Owenia fusiformis TaxID=6347 RepID=A0A8J1ULS2_OWEFU|nr:unnamed protein product [Owenia fusiformis]
MKLIWILLCVTLILQKIFAAPVQNINESESEEENEIEKGKGNPDNTEDKRDDDEDDILPEDLKRITETEEGKFKNAMTNKDSRWPNGVVPYVIDSSYERWELDVIKAAMEEITMATAFKGTNCISFKQRTIDKDYVKISPIGGCYSRVGVAGKEQPISISKGCVRKGTIMHELLHTLGFWHEQSRADRDRYISINWANIKEGHAGNFNKFKESNINHLEMPYDYNSIMHYSKSAFAKDWQYPTIIPTLKEGSTYIGQRTQLSPVDINKVRILYGCKGVVKIDFTTPTTPAPPTTTTPGPMPKGKKATVDCNFDKDTCGFSDVAGAVAWIRHTGKTDSGKTGPDSDHTSGKGYYMYTEASSNYGNTFKLDSPALSKGAKCLDFWYHMWSEDEKEDNEFHVGSIVVNLVNGKAVEEVWRAEADQGNKWHNGRVSIPANKATGKTFSLRFEGTILRSYKSDMGIDDIRIYDGLCP